MKRSFLWYLFVFTVWPLHPRAQTVQQLVEKVKAKIDQVKDYTATGRMKTNVSFLKVPVANVVIYFRKPDQLKIKNEKGISFVPRGAVSINLNNVLSNGAYTVLDAGKDKVNGIAVQVVKLLPVDDNAEVVLSTLYIDEARLVILKSRTTTRDNGSYELEMSYGNYVNYGLPDKILFSFNTKEYKLPKGITFDFDDGAPPPKETAGGKGKKGRAEISIRSYTINKGLSGDVFK